MTASHPQHVWTAADQVHIPETDILAFTFEHINHFENNRPVSYSFDTASTQSQLTSSLLDLH